MLTVGAFPGTIGNMAPYFASYIRQAFSLLFKVYCLYVLLLKFQQIQISYFSIIQLIFLKEHNDFILKNM